MDLLIRIVEGKGREGRPQADEETKVEDLRYASKETYFSTKSSRMLAKVGLNPEKKNTGIAKPPLTPC